MASWREHRLESCGSGLGSWGHTPFSGVLVFSSVNWILENA